VTPSKPLKVSAAVAAGLLAALALWWYWGRGPSAQALVSKLPDRPGATLSIDVTALRAAGLMERIAAPEAAQEQDYRDFVAATGFDYTRDLDRLAARFSAGGELWIAASGRFEPAKLAAYAAARGGRCVRGLCSLQGSGPDRQISWLEPDGRLLLMAVSPDPLAAAIMDSGKQPGWKLPASPVWLHLPGSQLKPAGGLPPGASALLSSLEGAGYALFWAGLSAKGFTIELSAPFKDGAAAQACAGRLQDVTGLFNKLLARERPQDGSAALARVLSSGRFHVEASAVRGAWSADRTFLDEWFR
jgi:hypothetical protein